MLTWYSHLASWLHQLHLVLCSVACLSASWLSFLPVLKTFLPARETLSCIGPDWTLEPCFLALPNHFLASGRRPFSCRDARPADKYRLHGCCKGEPSSCNRCNATFQMENALRAHIGRKRFFDFDRDQSTKVDAGRALCTPLFSGLKTNSFNHCDATFGKRNGSEASHEKKTWRCKQASVWIASWQLARLLGSSGWGLDNNF